MCISLHEREKGVQQIISRKVLHVHVDEVKILRLSYLPTTEEGK